MSLAREYTQEWLGFWTYVAVRAQNAMFRAVHEIEERRYSSSDVISDVVSFWTDVAVASATAMRGESHKPPTVVFTVSADDDIGGSKTLPIHSQSLPYESPRVIWLGPTASDAGESPPAGQELASGNLEAWLYGDRRELVLKLIGFTEEQRTAACGATPATIRPAQRNRPLLRPATYRAVVHVGHVPVAEVLIVVEAVEALDPSRRPA